MEFQEFNKYYLNETVPDNKIKILNTLDNSLDKKSIVDFLSTQYKNEADGRVRASIINYIGNNSSEISILIDALTDNFIDVKKTAVKLLGKIKNTRALNPLINMLNNPSLEIKDDILTSIINLGKIGEIHDIIANYDKGNIHIKRNIPIILGKIQNEESISFLKELIHKNDPEVRCNAVQALENQLQAKDARLIINLLDDVDLEVIKASIKALGTIKSKWAINPLLNMLKNKDEDIRALAIKSLIQIYSTDDNFDKIYEVANSRNMLARKSAIKLLGELKDLQSTYLFIKSLYSSDSKLRNIAYNSIINISEQKIPNEVFDELSSRDWKVRSLCAKIIGKLGNENQKKSLIPLLSDEDSRVRDMISNTLSTVREQKTIDEIKSLLRKSNWKTRRSIVKLLIKIGTKESLDDLISLIDDDDIFIKSWIAMALGKPENIEDISPFIGLLEDEDPKLRIAAARALGQMGNKECLKSLSKALWDDNWDVRKEVENALNKIDPNWLKNL